MKREGILLIFLLIILANISFVSASVVINEVMYNPNQCDDSYCEWIELYNNGTDVNLTDWDICGKKLISGYVNKSGSVNLNTTMVLSSGLYAIISDGGSGTEVYDNFGVSSEAIALHVDASSLCGGLSANEIIMTNDSSGALIDFVLINSSIGADNDGNSLQLVNSSWCANLPTPGTANSCPSPNQPPIANFIFSPANPTANQTVTFDASSSNDSDGSITSYKWDFGDGANATGSTAQHAFNTAGSFTVNLTVVDNSNATNSTLRTISVVQNQTNTTQNCLLEITYAPAEAYFGSTIDINISVYRNETAKYAVYLWIWDNERELLTENISLHAKNSTNGKSTNYTFNASLEIDEKCNVTNRTFMIVLEGMYEKINKSITLKENNTLCLPDFQYLITPVTTAKINETFSTKVRITNNKNTDTEFDVWSYVYRGGKCYSCLDDKRDENLNHVLVEADSYTEISLYNIVKDAEPGNYSFKVKILRENTETEKEYTFGIQLEAPSIELQEEIATESNLNAQTLNTSNKTLATGKAIYTSKTELNKRYAEIILISVSILISLYFIFKPKIIAMREHGV